MIVTQISDLLTGKNVTENYRLLQKTQWYDRAEMNELQMKKLRDLINHCYQHVPYYREYMQLHAIKPEDITSIDQLKSFPIISKEIIKANYEKFIPDNIKAIKGIKTSQTGGTTGNILLKRNDANTRSAIWATYKRFHDWMGIDERDKKLILMGGHVIGSNYRDSLKKTVNNLLTNSISFSPYDTSNENIQNIVKSLNNNHFDLIRSYSQFLFSLSQRLKNKGLMFDVKAITTTAEPLMPHHRDLFTEVFNAQAFDQYGCGEIGGISYECDHHKGMHVSEEHVILELNDKNDLIITDLDNYAMPFIRYWNADQAIISDDFCSCGRKSKLIKQILGRTCDYVIGLKDEFLHWAYFWHLLFDSNISIKRDLRKFQIVQKSRDEINIRLVSEKLLAEEEKTLINNIQERLGPLRVNFIYEDDIENAKSGKYRPVVNELIV